MKQRGSDKKSKQIFHEKKREYIQELLSIISIIW